MALIQRNLRLERFRFGLVSKMDLVQIQSDLAKGGLLIDSVVDGWQVKSFEGTLEQLREFVERLKNEAL